MDTIYDISVVQSQKNVYTVDSHLMVRTNRTGQKSGGRREKETRNRGNQKMENRNCELIQKNKKEKRKIILSDRVVQRTTLIIETKGEPLLKLPSS